jgi:hypothetical protein
MKIVIIMKANNNIIINSKQNGGNGDNSGNKQWRNQYSKKTMTNDNEPKTIMCLMCEN